MNYSDTPSPCTKEPHVYIPEHEEREHLAGHQEKDSDQLLSLLFPQPNTWDTVDSVTVTRRPSRDGNPSGRQSLREGRTVFPGLRTRTGTEVYVDGRR